jgi:hypothetical protein
MTLRVGLRGAAGLVALLVCAACAKPPPDLDAQATGAQALALETWHPDSLDCTKRVMDCGDWYAFPVPGEGRVQVDVVKKADDQPTPQFELVLGDASGHELERRGNQGQSRVQIKAAARTPRMTVAVLTPAGSKGRMSYEIRARFEPRREAPAPRIEHVSAVVLEVETSPGGGQAVLIDKGRKAGFTPGLRGRLLEGGQKIADIEIVDVYPDGSRAAIRGTLAAPITPSTVAEVDVPL